MAKKFTARAAVTVNAPAEKVWRALTDPALIKQYLFGTDAESDWKPGSPIRYRGVWEGKPYEDKGTILKAVPGKILQSTFWSAASGRPDTPENYYTVTQRLREKGGATTLDLTQENCPSREDAEHSAANWSAVLGKLKELLEKLGA
jgi:uncharacterized protein YndB with AHSA1/START domain